MMIQYERRFRFLAMCLAALAGFVDAIGFILTGGLFVSFMSGNSTRMAVGLAAGNAIFLLAGGLILGFFLGVVAGALAAPWKPHRRKTLILFGVTLLLLGAAILAATAHPVPAALMLAFAMGALNNVFLREGEVSIPVTYMTGSLVRAGQKIAAAIRGDRSADWLAYFLLWTSLVTGAGTGAFAAAFDPVVSIWIASAIACLLGLASFRLESGRSP